MTPLLSWSSFNPVNHGSKPSLKDRVIYISSQWSCPLKIVIELPELYMDDRDGKETGIFSPKTNSGLYVQSNLFLVMKNSITRLGLNHKLKAYE